MPRVNAVFAEHSERRDGTGAARREKDRRGQNFAAVVVLDPHDPRSTARRAARHLKVPSRGRSAPPYDGSIEAMTQCVRAGAGATLRVEGMTSRGRGTWRQRSKPTAVRRRRG